MAQSLRKRLNGDMPEFLEYTRRYGVWSAMEKWKFRDYVAVRKILTEETGDESFGLRPVIRPDYEGGFEGMVREFVQAFANYVIKMDKENEVLKRQLEVFRTESNRKKEYFMEQLIPVMEAMR